MWCTNNSYPTNSMLKKKSNAFEPRNKAFWCFYHFWKWMWLQTQFCQVCASACHCAVLPTGRFSNDQTHLVWWLGGFAGAEQKIRLGGDVLAVKFQGFNIYHPQIHPRWKLGASSSLRGLNKNMSSKKSTFMGQFFCFCVRVWGVDAYCQELMEGRFLSDIRVAGRWECMKLWMGRKVCDMNQMRYVNIFHAYFTSIIYNIYIYIIEYIYCICLTLILTRASYIIDMCVMIDECMWCARVIHLLCSCLLSNSLGVGHWVPQRLIWK